MGKVVINPKYCKSCSLCLIVCKKNAIMLGEKINEKGYNYVVPNEENLCSGCSLCAIVCPDSAIEVYR